MAPTGKTGRYRGSVKEFPNFTASQDAEALYNAMKGFGSDKEAILDLITSRNNKQRIEISQAYKSLYGKDLIADLKRELTGKFERLIVGLMRPLAYFDAKEIKDALQGIGTDEKCLIEILASRTNQQIHNLVEAYRDAYERELEADVLGDTSGHFKKMLVVLLQGTREEDDVVSEDLVEQDAKDLLEAGDLKWGTDEAQFIYILGNRSKQHLRLVFDEYLKISGKPIEDSIRGELSGDIEKLLLAVVKCIRSTPEYFAERLYKAMKGLGTKDNTLIRVMVSRSEIDMLDIREVFRTKYEKSLHSMIKDDTSGEYKKGRAVLFPLCFQGAGTDENILIEILATRNNREIQAINEAYKAAYHKSLEDALSSDTSGHFKRILVSLALVGSLFLQCALLVGLWFSNLTSRKTPVSSYNMPNGHPVRLVPGPDPQLVSIGVALLKLTSCSEAHDAVGIDPSCGSGPISSLFLRR
uniref:Annexin n=1 Tax=Terrapene triunguis TaxID=2587831 RepID=A0A674IBX3_9SAUR